MTQRQGTSLRPKIALRSKCLLTKQCFYKDLQKNICNHYCLFVLFEWTPSKRKESGYPIRDFASRSGTEQRFLHPQARSIPTTQLPGIKPSAWLDTKQPRRPKQIRIQSALGGTWLCTPPLVELQVQCRPSASHFEPLGGELQRYV